MFGVRFSSSTHSSNWLPELAESTVSPPNFSEPIERQSKVATQPVEVRQAYKNYCIKQARRILGWYWPCVTALAGALLEKRTLIDAEARRVIKGVTDETLEQYRRGLPDYESVSRWEEARIERRAPCRLRACRCNAPWRTGAALERDLA